MNQKFNFKLNIKHLENYKNGFEKRLNLSTKSHNEMRQNTARVILSKKGVTQMWACTDDNDELCAQVSSIFRVKLGARNYSE